MSPDGGSRGFTIRAFHPSPEDAQAASGILRESKEAAAWPEIIFQAGSFDPRLTFAFFSEVAGQPTGFIVGRQVAGEGELLNLAVKPSFRGQGQGQALLEQLLHAFREHSVTRVFLEVRESNAVAIAFYERYGFRRVGDRPGYYRDPVEAALVYRKLLESTG